MPTDQLGLFCGVRGGLEIECSDVAEVPSAHNERN